MYLCSLLDTIFLHSSHLGGEGGKVVIWLKFLTLAPSRWTCRSRPEVLEEERNRTKCWQSTWEAVEGCQESIEHRRDYPLQRDMQWGGPKRWPLLKRRSRCSSSSQNHQIHHDLSFPPCLLCHQLARLLPGRERSGQSRLLPCFHFSSRSSRCYWKVKEQPVSNRFKVSAPFELSSIVD